MQQRKKEEDRHLTTLKTIDLNRLVSKYGIYSSILCHLRFEFIMCKGGFALLYDYKSETMNNINGVVVLFYFIFQQALIQQIF